MILLACIIGITVACAVIWKASDGFEAAADFLGRNLSDGVKGATINAIGSSMPEFFTTLFFLLILKDDKGFGSGLATTAGSAIFNGIVIPALVILAVVGKRGVSWVSIGKKTIRRDGIALLTAEIVLFTFLLSGTLYWYHGLILMLLYFVYMFIVLKKAKKTEVETSTDFKYSPSTPKSRTRKIISLDLEGSIRGDKSWSVSIGWFLLLVSVVIIGGASAVLVLCCEELGKTLGINVYFIAVILASAATSIPDTFLSIKDARKGNYDDALANALGSNVFDLCFALGLPLFVYCLFAPPIVLGPETTEDTTELMLLLIGLTFITYYVYRFTSKLKRVHAYFLLSLYLFFVTFVAATALEADWIKPVSNFTGQTILSLKSLLGLS